MPVQDFRYSIKNGFDNQTIEAFVGGETGEALSRQGDGYADEFYNNGADDFWNDQYSQIRQINYFKETLLKYSSNFSASQISEWTAESHFLRAYSYYALAKRYGGVPIYTTAVEVTGADPESYAIPRNSEEEVWDLVASDLDIAIADLPEKSETGRANKYVAAALKSRAMLHVGSIAKYNEIQSFDGSIRLQGIPAEKAAAYFQAAHDAALLLEGNYSLYKAKWSAGNRNAQINNFRQLFFDGSSPENILIKQYYYPDFSHSYDVFMVPRQLQGPGGGSAMLNPTLDFVQMFDGMQKDPDGTISGLDPSGNNTYLMFDDPNDFFASAEPRLLATSLVPGSTFKGETIEIYAGVYTGDIPAEGLQKLTDKDDFLPYTSLGGKLLMTKIGSNPVGVELPDGSQMNASGASGPFLNDNSGAMTGFSVLKYLEENLAIPDRAMSTQTYIDMRYAEVLLNRAEAAYELGNIDDAYSCIIQIQERAGAEITDLADFSLETVRKERRKELAFENHAYFDLKRWRIMQSEMTDKYYYGFFPMYASQTGKWFFDKKAVNRYYNMQESKNYYQRIPGGALSKNKFLIQNFGY
ncbi:MAG: RagB/SusD family nutrient uptake outer membrane protein [Bacteroidales bacterium]|nr:RagB/SusD family nutrient uptake outer membrane protein [Bacteroidales bacterium]